VTRSPMENDFEWSSKRARTARDGDEATPGKRGWSGPSSDRTKTPKRSMAATVPDSSCPDATPSDSPELGISVATGSRTCCSRRSTAITSAGDSATDLRESQDCQKRRAGRWCRTGSLAKASESNGRLRSRDLRDGAVRDVADVSRGVTEIRTKGATDDLESDALGLHLPAAGRGSRSATCMMSSQRRRISVGEHVAPVLGVKTKCA